MTPTVQLEVERPQVAGPQALEPRDESRDPVPASLGVRKRATGGIRSCQGGGPAGRGRVVAVGTDIGLLNLFTMRDCGVCRRQDVLISSC